MGMSLALSCHRLRLMSLHFMFFFNCNICEPLSRPPLITHYQTELTAAYFVAANSYFGSLLLFILCMWPSRLTFFSMRISAIDSSPARQRLHLRVLVLPGYVPFIITFRCSTIYRHGASPCTAFSQALSVNSLRWRIRVERAQNTFSLGPRDSKRFGRAG